ncbi:anaerobic C4-dicarboxylate transporter family protein, partial [Tsukamurella conjunctivitidis]
MLVCIAIGSRMGGIALGFWGGVGMVVIVTVFREPAADPPMDVMLI